MVLMFHIKIQLFTDRIVPLLSLQVPPKLKKLGSALLMTGPTRTHL
uniref:Uncharacterized protein n=1 Tax=Picea glauca TaxID=3330 RepID=A0A101LYK6_PICGL|nr:hypothetical protein ABT39_MTgene5911 [Picea glauca]QHR92056.1 hypothetical protein Q903MT_gene6092 [Picea sitchensis]